MTEMSAGHQPRKLLVLDLHFTLEMIRQRGLEESVTCRDLGGFFEHVWTVHPFATMLTSDGWTPRYGPARTHRLSARHSFIEGTIGRFAWLRAVPPLNFALSQLSLFLGLVRLIRTESIGAIRAGDGHYLGLLGLGLARLGGIPLVVRVGANYDLNRAASGLPMHPRLMRSVRVEKALERFVFRRADLVAGANQDNLDFALSAGARRERATLFRYGNLLDRRHFAEPERRSCDPARFDELGIAPGRFLLSVARLEAANALKHPQDVVDVVARVRSRGHDVKAVLAGDGRLRDMLTTKAEELGVGDAVIFAGNRDQGWLAEMLPHAAVVVSPHAGRALSEAALAAAPVVAYDIDWQRELIESGVTGILVPNRDWEEMAAGVERLLGDRAYARVMGDALRRRALAMLDPEQLDAHERAEYARLMAPKRASALAGDRELA